MRFPLSMTAGMAGYILKNKLRPRPEWQKDLAGQGGGSNPFSSDARAGHRQRRGAPSDDPEAVSAGADAGAVARLQPHLHGLRPDTRVPGHGQGEVVGGASAEGGGRVRGAGGIDLRRGAAAAPGYRAMSAEILARGKHIYLCTNGVFVKKRLPEFKPHSRFFINVHLDGLEQTTTWWWKRKGVFPAGRRRDTRRQGSGLQGDHQQPPSTKRRICGRSSSSSSTWSSSTWTGTC